MCDNTIFKFRSSVSLIIFNLIFIIVKSIIIFVTKLGTVLLPIDLATEGSSNKVFVLLATFKSLSNLLFVLAADARFFAVTCLLWLALSLIEESDKLLFDDSTFTAFCCAVNSVALTLTSLGSFSSSFSVSALASCISIACGDLSDKSSDVSALITFCCAANSVALISFDFESF